eukprot:14433017-Alexandrium_andersonii.AAC.1
MSRELAEFLQADARRAASSFADYENGQRVPPERIMKMRWVLVWKPVEPTEPPSGDRPTALKSDG